MDVDLAVVGAGGAGLSVLLALERRLPEGARPPTVALIDPVHRRGEDRTWCFWDAGPQGGDLDALLHRWWRRVEVVDRAGRPRVLDLGTLRYAMLRSGAFYARAERAAARLGTVRVTGEAGEAGEAGDGLVRVRTPGGQVEVRARWILDSRPATPRRRPCTALLQHFRGWTVRTDRRAFDPDLPVFMDFSVPQPARGVAFGYVLPTDGCTALVEYTQFSRARLEPPEYDDALRRYLHERYGLAPGAYAVEHVEDGAIPMTDAVHAGRAGRATFRIGTAGGATRGSTGYTFAAMQRQADAMAGELLAGRAPSPPPAYPARHRWMDAVMLRAVDLGPVHGADLLLRLLDRNPPERVLRFLDGGTAPVEELRLMATAPVAAMARAAAGNAMARASRRLRP